MGVRDLFRVLEPDPQYREVTPQALLENYDFVEASDGYLIVADQRQMQEVDGAAALADMSPTYAVREIGSTSTMYGNIMREEYNNELRGDLGLQKYDRMRRSDGGVRSTLRAIKTPILGARWFVSPANQGDEAREQADFVSWNLFKGMSISWPQVVWEALLMLDFGYYTFEKVFEVGIWKNRPVMYWQKLAPRHPLDLAYWSFDRGGGPNAAWFHDANTGKPKPISISKLAVFTFDKEAGNIEGISLLRSAYKHWFYKENLYKIDAIQKERHGVGVPIIKLPANYTAEDKRLADEFGRNLRSNEKAHVVLPPFWEIMFAKLEGQHVNAMQSAEHHNRMMYENILASFLVDPQNSGSDFAGELFLKSTRYIAEIIRDVFNKYCIPQLIDMNWSGVQEYPELRVRRIGDVQDWRMISFALRNLVGSGIIQVDDDLETWIRDEMDLPPLDESSIREVASPQQPRVGPPRQSTAPGMRNQAGSPSNRGGQDRSGNSGTGTR